MKALLIIAAAAALFSGPALAQTTIVQKEAGGPYVKPLSPYLAYVQVGQCGAEGLTPAECGGRIYIDPAKFPANSVISWSLPYRAAKSGKPWGYPALSRGQPSGGRPAVIDPPKRLVAVASLTLKLDADLSLIGPGADASVLSDTFLYAPGFTGDPVAELGVFPYIGKAAKAWAVKQPLIRTGIYRDGSGRSWTARRADKYSFFYLEAGDALKGEIDLRGFLDYLAGAGLVSGDMIYPGTALGVEPGAGAGTLLINGFSVDPG